MAFKAAIHGHLSAKKTKAETALLARLALCYREVFGEPIERLMKLPEAEFHQLCLGKVLDAFNPAKDHYFSVDEARPLAEYLGVDPAESWKPTAELLKECTAAEVVAVGETLEITADGKSLPAKISPRSQERRFPTCSCWRSRRSKKGRGKK